MSNFLWEYILLLPACKYFKLIIYADRMLPIPLLLLFVPITHDDDVDACIAKIIIIFRSQQCSVRWKIVENLWEKFCFFRFSNAWTSIYWWTWKVLLTGCNRRFIKSVINALHFHSHMEWFRFIPGAQKMNLLDEESAFYSKIILIKFKLQKF